jgi:hypothetical protein
MFSDRTKSFALGTLLVDGADLWRTENRPGELVLQVTVLVRQRLSAAQVGGQGAPLTAALVPAAVAKGLKSRALRPAQGWRTGRTGHQIRTGGNVSTGKSRRNREGQPTGFAHPAQGLVQQGQLQANGQSVGEGA